MKNRYLLLLFIGYQLLFMGCTYARHLDKDTSNAAFEYREIYLPEGIRSADTLGLNSLDEDWAIWGHNLGKVLPEKHSESIYAKVNGNTLKNQFCFTSPRLYAYIEEYIIDQYGEDGNSRFAIIPNDNDIVCLCEACVAVGNTKEDASPAVFSLVRKLAERFPTHTFYTSDYRTTRNVPKDVMPQNTGVTVSAMPYPFTYSDTPEGESFLKSLAEWSSKTKKVMVWDYINNFDDYFTPFPILGLMQNRLKNYRDNNVTAVFLNGSGEDASLFSSLNTHVLAALTLNPDADWKSLLREKALELYPVAGNVIADFIISQDEYIKENGVVLPLYEGVAKAIQIYLPEESFNKFYDSIVESREKASEDEKKALNVILAEMALTKLELNRINSNLEGSETFLKHLSSLPEAGIETYSESGWRLESYIRDYDYLLSHAREVEGKNKIKGVGLKALTPLDEDYTDISILTDGVLGMPSNYHNGHLINSPENVASISIPHTEGAEKLVVWLSFNPAYKIFLPENVTFSGEGLQPIIKEPVQSKDHTGHSKVEFEIPRTAAGPFTLTFKKAEDTKSFAIEEIELF